MDVTREIRPLEYEVVPFAGREAETITVLAEHRAIGFSLAAAKAHDPTNVWKVRLLRDHMVGFSIPMIPSLLKISQPFKIQRYT